MGKRSTTSPHISSPKIRRSKVQFEHPFALQKSNTLIAIIKEGNVLGVVDRIYTYLLTINSII